MMGKFVFWVGVFALIWLAFRLFQVLKRKAQPQQPSSAAAGRDRPDPGAAKRRTDDAASVDAPAPMIRCGHCGLYLPASEAVRGGALAYCSVEHRDAGPSEPTERR